MNAVDRKRAVPSDIAPDHRSDLVTPRFNGPLSDSELDELINLLIETIRAGAKVAAVFACRASCQDKRGMYLDIQADASKAIQQLSRVLKARGVEPSDATNGFFDRAMELPERSDRVAFFVRGQAWLLATLHEALPHLPDPEIATVFRECAEQVERNRAQAQAYLATI